MARLVARAAPSIVRCLLFCRLSRCLSLFCRPLSGLPSDAGTAWSGHQWGTLRPRSHQRLTPCFLRPCASCLPCLRRWCADLGMTCTSCRAKAELRARAVPCSHGQSKFRTPGSRPGESHSSFPHPRPPKRTRPSESPTPVKRQGDEHNPLNLD